VPFTSQPGHEVDAERVKELLDAGEIELIDVREQYEWDAGRVAGARHIELERVAGRAHELPKDRPIVFSCRLGARSAMVTEAFRASGYDAYNMTGGLIAWVERGLPLDPQGGTVADH
jgi:hydroxyacylglutathione hydrolase/adenylyltransferase/sulfurtransferase